MKASFALGALVLALRLQPGPALAQPNAAAPPPDLAIAAASDLQTVFPQIADRFKLTTGRAARLTYGSSGNFFAQIQNGAPFDVFFSADAEYPRQLLAAGLAEPGTLVHYAVGSIVVWARKDSGVDVSAGLKALDSPKVRKIAIANPDHAPYGRAAVAALEHEGLYERVKAKLVLGENISQAAQFAQSGSADAGILALSLAYSPVLSNAGVYAEVPPAFYPAIDQAAVIVRASLNKDLARQFLALLEQPEISTLMRRFGFLPPSDAAR